jgi:WD40 repeat protein
MRDPSSPRVFLSYSRKDGLEVARRLQAILEAEGLSLYRDLSDLDGGEDWWRQVETAIKGVEHVVLVLTPQALQSRYVRDEWKLARQEGKAVWPVSGPGELDFSHLPHWMARANRHDIHIPESRNRLILGLSGPAREKRVPFMADPLPAGFVARPEKLAEIKRKILNSQGEPFATTAALRGAGGFGKTALANALCHDREIESAFSDGILRVVLGEKPEDLVGRIADLIEILTGERPGVTHLEAAKTKLAEALDDRRCFLVIDDAWREQDLAPFLHRGSKDQTTRLITTRDDRVLPAEATRVNVDAMTSDQALAMLERGLPGDLLPPFRVRLTAMAGRLGEWALLLALANGVLRARTARGGSIENALSYAERALAQRGLAAAFSSQDRATRRSTAWGTLEVSLEQLSESERMCFAELAVFIEDAEIPTGAVLGLWKQTAELDALDGEDLLTRLADLSLLIDLDLGRGLFRLHDVFRSLLRAGPVRDRLAELDRKLMEHFRATCPNEHLSQLKDSYGLRYSIAHLRGAGEGEVADLLLLDLAWMQAKLDSLGIQPLLADYIGQPLQSPQCAIGAVLTLGANVLSRRPQELPTQMLARLSCEAEPRLEATLRDARARLVQPALVPLRASFTPPGAELRRFEGHERTVNSLAALADQRRALSASDDGTLRLWDLETGVELRRFEGHRRRVNTVAVLADHRRALSGSDDGTLRLWDVESGAELGRLDGHEGPIKCLMLLADEERALSGSQDMTLRLWDLASCAEVRRLTGHERDISSITELPGGKRALSSSWDNSVRLWDLEAGGELRCIKVKESVVTALTALADGQRALFGCSNGMLWLWDLESDAALRSLAGHDSAVTSITLFADGRRALSGSFDRTLRLWDLESGVELRRFDGHEDWVTSVTLLNNGQRALSGSADKTLRLWDLEIGVDQGRFASHKSSISSMALLADERRVLTGSWDKTLRLWDLKTGAELRRFTGHEDAATCVTVLADERHALSGSYDETLRLWNLETGSELRRFEGHEGFVTSVALLADGRCALSGSGDGTLRLWDLETGTELRHFEAHKHPVSSVTLLTDKRLALSGSWDRTLRLWDLETGAELRRFEGHEAWVNAVSLLSDGWRALSASEDKTLRLWDLKTGSEERRLEGHEAEVTSVTILTNRQRALSASRDKTLRLWDLETGTQLACLTFDAIPFAIAWSERMSAAVVGDGMGLVHVIELLDRPPAAAPVSRDSRR